MPSSSLQSDAFAEIPAAQQRSVIEPAGRALTHRQILPQYQPPADFYPQQLLTTLFIKICVPDRGHCATLRNVRTTGLKPRFTDMANLLEVAGI